MAVRAEAGVEPVVAESRVGEQLRRVGSVVFAFAPLVRKELVTELRRLRPFVWILLVSGAMAIGVLEGWPSMNLNPLDMRYFAVSLYQSIVIVLFAATCLFVPGVAATAIVREKEAGEWEGLWLSLIGPVGIVLGKWISVVGLFVLFTFAVFPFIASVLFLVGVDWVQIATVLAFILVTAANLGMIGVALSANLRGALAALVVAYVCVAWVLGAPAFVVIVWNEVATEFFYEGDWLNIGIPEDILVASASSAVFVAFFNGALPAGLLTSNIMYQGICALLAFFVAVWGVRRRSVEPALPRGGGEPKRRRGLRRLSVQLVDPVGIRPPIADRANPVYHREITWGVFRRGTWFIRLVYGFFILLFGISMVAIAILLQEPMPTNDMHFAAIGVALAHAALVCGFLPLCFSGIYTKENREGCLDMLRMTLLTSRDIVRGKFHAGLRLGFVLYAISLVTWSPVVGFVAWKGADWISPLIVESVVIAWVVITLVITMCASMLVRSHGQALVSAYGAAFVCFAGMALLVGYFQIGPRTGNHFQWIQYMASPVFAIGVVMDNSAQWESEYRLLYLLNPLFYLTLSYCAYRVCGAFYEKRRMQERDSLFPRKAAREAAS